VSRPKTAGSKEEKAQQAEDLKARKERDAAMGYMYAPCNYCGQAVRWKLPRGMEKTEENLKKYEPKSCGSEECATKFAENEMERRRA